MLVSSLQLHNELLKGRGHVQQLHYFAFFLCTPLLILFHALYKLVLFPFHQINCMPGLLGTSLPYLYTCI